MLILPISNTWAGNMKPANLHRFRGSHLHISHFDLTEGLLGTHPICFLMLRVEQVILSSCQEAQELLSKAVLTT